MAISLVSFVPNSSPVTAPEQTTVTFEVQATESNSVALLYQWQTSTDWNPTSQTGTWSNVTGATTATYTTPALTTADDARLYRVLVYTVSPSQQVYYPSVNGIELNVVPPTILLITTPLNSQYSVSVNSTLSLVFQSTFSSESSATTQSAVDGISYQWQKRLWDSVTSTYGSWTNVTTSATLTIQNETVLDQLTAGLTQFYRRSTLTYSGVPFSENLAQYRAILTSSVASNSPLTSESTTIIVGATLSISKQPGVAGSAPGSLASYDNNATTIQKWDPGDVYSISPSVTFFPGRTVLSVTASSTAGGLSTLSYLWQYQTSSTGSWQDIVVSGQGLFNASNYATNSIILTEIGFATYLKFRVTVSGTANETAITSNEVSLTITQTIEVSEIPFPVNAPEGSTATFSCLLNTTAQSGTEGDISTKWQRKDPGSAIWNDITSYTIGSQAFYTTPTLVTATDNGAYYRVQIDAINATNEPFYSPNSSGVLLSVYSFVNITTQPATSSVYTNQVASFAITAAASNNASLTYQWQVRPANSGSWSNISNGGSYSGATTSILLINPATASFNNYRYRCVVNAGGTIASVTSTEVYLYILPDNFTFVNTLNDQYLLQGDAIVLTASAQSASLSSISYQWQKSTNYSPSNPTAATWNDVSGATNATLTIASSSASDTGYYRYRATSFGGVVTYSNAAYISVTALNINVVLNSSAAVTVLENANNQTTFSVTATPTIGSNLTYEWQYNTNPTGNTGWSPFGNGYAGMLPNSNLYTPAAFTRSQSGLRVRCSVTGTGIPGIYNSSEIVVTVNRRLTYIPIPTTLTIAANEFQTIDLAPTYTGGSISYQWQSRASSSGSWANISGETTQALTIIGYSASQVPTAGAVVVNNGNQIRCLVTLTDATEYQFFTAATGLSTNAISPAGSQIIVNKNASPDLTSTVSLIATASFNVLYSIESAKSGAAIGTVMCIPKPGTYTNPGATGNDDSMLWNVPHSSVVTASNTEKLKYDKRFVGWLPLSASPLMSGSNNNNGAMLNAIEFPELARIMGNTFGGSLNTYTSTTGFLPPKTGSDGNSGGVSGTFGLPLVFGKKLFGTGAVNNNAASVSVVTRYDALGASGSLNAVGYIGGAYNYLESEQLPVASGGTAGTSTINPNTFTLGTFTTTGWADAIADVQTSYSETISYGIGPLSEKTFTTPTVHSHQMTSYTQVSPNTAPRIGRWDAVGANDACKEINADSGEQVAGVPYIGDTISHSHGITTGDPSAEGQGHSTGTGGAGSSTLSGSFNQNESGTFLSNGSLVMSQQSNSLWNSALSFTLANADKISINTPHFRLKYYIKSW